jgi:sugar phosphate permease
MALRRGRVKSSSPGAGDAGDAPAVRGTVERAAADRGAADRDSAEGGAVQRGSARGADGRTFHGWRIVGGAVVMQSLQSLLFWQAFATYAALWMADFGWSRTTISWAASLQRTESGLLGPLHGWWLDRSSPRRVFVAGVLLMGSGLIGLGFVQDFTQFIVLYLIASIGSSLAGMLTLMTVVVNWFDRQRARALAGLQLGLSLGSLALPLLAWALVGFGWRPVIIASGLLIIAVGLPIARLLHRDPESLGLRPDGDEPQEATARPEQPAAPTARRSWAGGALRTPAFWLISLGHGAALAIMSGVGVHFVIYATEVLDIGITTAATLMAVMTASAVAGQLAGGIAGDRIDKRWLAGGAMLSHSAAMAALVVASGTALVAVAAILHGLAWGVRGPLMGAMRADHFGRAAFASVMGFSSLVVMVGSVGGPLVIGLVADGTGSYAGGFAALAVVGLVGAAAFFVLGRPAPPRR